MINTPTLILILLAGAVALFFCWKAFNTFVRVRGNDLVKKGTTPLERNKLRLSDLKAKLPGERKEVADCMATVDDINKKLGDAQKEVKRLEGEYKTAKETGASEAALNGIGTDYEKAEQSVETIKARLTEAQSASDEAQKALDDTIEALKAFGDKIEDQELKTHLAAAIRTSAAAKQQAKDITDKLSEASEDFDSSEHDLNVARNEGKLADGSATDRERADIAKKAAAKTGRDKLEALTGGSSAAPATPANPPAKS